MAAYAQNSDVGPVIRLTVTQASDSAALDLSSATTLEIIIKQPKSKTVLTKTATLTNDGTDGQMEYTTVSGDLDENGVYQVQGHVVIGSQDFYTSVTQFRINPNVSES